MQKERVLPYRDAPLGPSVAPTTSKGSALAATSWPSAGTADVTVPAGTTRARAGALPVLLSAKSAATTPSAAVSASTSVRVQVADQATAASARVGGMLFSITRKAASTTPLSVAVDYSSFRNAAGANFGQRLQLVSLPACALTTPNVPACQVQTPIASRNDAVRQVLTATAGGTTATTAPAARSSAQLASADGSTTVLAAVAGPSGPNGSFAASSLAPSGSWSVSGASGSFQWSYPINTPAPATGSDVAPSVGLSYNSGSVDGRIASTNNQSSWIGEGWDYTPGYIERSYRTCADDTALPTAQQTGDQCWAGQIVTMNLGGKTTALVRDDSTGDWHPADDSGAQVELAGAGSGAYQGEHWKITTTDGVIYFFGRDTLPGGAATHATWTETVYGAHDNDPCHGADFAHSRCTQAWRWNLDYVVDPHHNATAYYYTAEQNYYSASNGTSPATYTTVGYTRGGYLTRIDYGLREENDNAYAVGTPDQVSFTLAERCIPSGTITCSDAQFTVANAASWPDTPVDQKCAATGTCNNHSPTFWTRKRVTTITTTAGGKVLDTYALVQCFPSKCPTNLGGDPELRLQSITRTAHATDGTTTTIAMPAVRFTYALRANRVHGWASQVDMQFWRISRIEGDTGQIITVHYSADDDQTGRAQPFCTAASAANIDPAHDTAECFPVKWTPPLNTTPILDYFHKYLTTQVDVADRNAIAPSRITTYTYVGGVAWHADDNEIVKAANRTYGQFRGYQKVETRTGNPNSASNGTPDAWTLSTATYYRGMGGSFTDSLGDSATDDNRYSDTPREVRTFSGSGGTEISTAITTPTVVTTTATRARTGLPALTADVVKTSTSTTYTDLAAGGTRATTSSYRYDDLGRLTAQTDTGTGVPAVCATIHYDDTIGSGIRDRVSEKITSQQSCPTSGAPAPILTDTRTTYNSLGDATEADTATDSTGGTLHFAKTTATYDTSGRPLSATSYVSAADTTGRTIKTDYTPIDGGVLSKTVTTNPLGQTSTALLEPARGVPTEAIDVAGHKTDATYDAMGRLTAVWRPGQVKGTTSATQTYAYLIPTSSGIVSGPLAVTTKTLIDTGFDVTPAYKTSVALYDAFGAARQTQSDAVTGDGSGCGRVVTEAFNDSHGWTIASNNRWCAAGAPATTLITTDYKGIDDRTQTTYDGAGRPTVVTAYRGDTATRSTRTVYGGDRTTVIPPAGGVESTTVTDARGHAIDLDQWTSPPTVNGNTISGGTAQRTTYGYTALGQQNAMTTAAGTSQAASFTSSYDLTGRVVSKTDPDTGTSTTSYDNTGAVISSTDANNHTLAFSYDALGRKIGEYTGSLTGTQLASWTYDTLQAGQPTSSTRYTTTGDYTVAATGYDGTGHPTGSAVTLPASEPVFGGTANPDGTRTYTTASTWTTTGLVHSQTLPGGGGQPTEPLEYTYDKFGDADSTTSPVVDAYATGAIYSPYGEPLRYTLGTNNQTGWLSYSRDPQTHRIATATLSAQTAIPQLEKVAYGYDPAGNTTRTVDTQGGGPNVPVETTCYGYTALDQLSAAWTPASGDCAAAPSTSGLGGPQPYWTSWSVDAAGNRSQQVQHAAGGDVTTNYTTATPGHAHALTGTTTTGAAPTGYTYDASGNTLTRTGVAGGDQTLSWDVENRLTTVHSPAGDTSYVYAADGTQLLRRSPGSTTLYLPSQEFTRTNSTGVVVCTRYYVHNGTVVSERVGDTNTTYLFTDPHGTTSVAVPTTQAGTATPIRRQLDPYGNQLGAAVGGTWPDQHGFLNAPADSGTGLTHLGARDYDPTIGRFVSVDPILDPGDPQSVNGYGYADNNPITHTDPTGLKLADCNPGDCGGAINGNTLNGNTTIGDSSPPPPGSGGSDTSGGSVASYLGGKLITALNATTYANAWSSAKDALYSANSSVAGMLFSDLDCWPDCVPSLGGELGLGQFATILCSQSGVTCENSSDATRHAGWLTGIWGKKAFNAGIEWAVTHGSAGALVLGAVATGPGGFASDGGDGEVVFHRFVGKIHEGEAAKVRESGYVLYGRPGKTFAGPEADGRPSVKGNPGRAPEGKAGPYVEYSTTVQPTTSNPIELRWYVGTEGVIEVDPETAAIPVRILRELP